MGSFVVLASVFVVVLIVSFRAISTGLGFDTASSSILSICVSLLSIVGLVHYLGDSMDAILLPYAALAISVAFVLILSFVCKNAKYLREHSIRRDTSEMRFKERRRRPKRKKKSRSIQKDL